MITCDIFFVLACFVSLNILTRLLDDFLSVDFQKCCNCEFSNALFADFNV